MQLAEKCKKCLEDALKCQVWNTFYILKQLVTSFKLTKSITQILAIMHVLCCYCVRSKFLRVDSLTFNATLEISDSETNDHCLANLADWHTCFGHILNRSILNCCIKRCRKGRYKVLWVWTCPRREGIITAWKIYRILSFRAKTLTLLASLLHMCSVSNFLQNLSFPWKW